MLKDNRWFSDVPPNLLVELWLRGKHKFIRRYAHIMREGLKGECFYVIIRGSVRIHSSAGIEQIYEQGMSFGEAGLVLDAHVRQARGTLRAHAHTFLHRVRFCSGCALSLRSRLADQCDRGGALHAAVAVHRRCRSGRCRFARLT